MFQTTNQSWLLMINGDSSELFMAILDHFPPHPPPDRADRDYGWRLLDFRLFGMWTASKSLRIWMEIPIDQATGMGSIWINASGMKDMIQTGSCWTIHSILAAEVDDLFGIGHRPVVSAWGAGEVGHFCCPIAILVSHTNCWMTWCPFDMKYPRVQYK